MKLLTFLQQEDIEEKGFKVGIYYWTEDKINNTELKYIRYSEYLAKVKKLNAKIKELKGVRND